MDKIDFEIRQLTRPKQIMLIGIDDISHELDYKLKDKLIDPPKGIYIKNKLTPVVSEIQPITLYQKTPHGLSPISGSLDDIQSAVLDYKGRVLIPEAVMSNKKDMLSTTPFYPYTALHLVIQYLRGFLYRNTTYKEFSKLSSDFNVDLFIKPELFEEIHNGTIERIIEDACIPLQRKCNTFIGTDVNNIYTLKPAIDEVTITKAGDWRALAYLMQRREAIDAEHDSKLGFNV